ncbi:hypothetical protein ACD661_01570 [Legionella lytica]|uniref:Coiled coil domain-containing protein n=1 Tax=Legionella lytica TaxID=96232 RepID=A0ABW8D6L8_9GAMM
MATGFFNHVVSALIDKLILEAPFRGLEQNPTKPEDRSLFNKVFGDRVPYQRFSPGAMAQLAEGHLHYLDSIGLGANATLATDAVDKFVTNRVNDVLKLTEAKTPDGVLIHEKLSDTDPNKRDAIKAVKKDINEILSSKALEEGVQKEYTASMAAFQELLAGSKKYHVQEVQGLLEDITKTAHTALKAQQKSEIAQLETLFENAEFQTNLATALDLPDGTEALEAVKKSMSADLAKKHETQLKAFEEDVKQAKTDLHKAAEQQLKAFLFMADLYKNDPKMQAMIEKLAEDNRPHANDVTLEVSEDRADISCVNLDQLQFIQRLGGGVITPTKDKDGNVLSYSLDMGMKFTNPRYYFNDHHKKDMEIMAQAIRASGSETITMSLNFKNEKVAQERAREAFEACLKSGFPPEKINIKVNGTLFTYQPKETDGKPENQAISSLYYDDKNPNKNKRARYETVVKDSEKTREALDAIIKAGVEEKLKGSTGDLTSIKDELHELKRKAAEVSMGVTRVSDEDHDDTRSLTHS